MSDVRPIGPSELVSPFCGLEGNGRRAGGGESRPEVGASRDAVGGTKQARAAKGLALRPPSWPEVRKQCSESSNAPAQGMGYTTNEQHARAAHPIFTGRPSFRLSSRAMVLSGVRFSKNMSLICTMGALTHAPRHSTSVRVKFPSLLVSPALMPKCASIVCLASAWDGGQSRVESVGACRRARPMHACSRALSCRPKSDAAPNPGR
eukprot:scaffold28677_cov112-Isochrysis_galbana.AAC.10